jgi:hypothetical protein
MKYSIYQIHLTEAQYDLVNAEGHMAVPAHVAKMDMSMDFRGDKITDQASEAWDNGYYTHVSNIEAENLNQVFEIGNIGPEENIERLSRMHSISVADVIINETGEMVVVASAGFKVFTSKLEKAA